MTILEIVRLIAHMALATLCLLRYIRYDKTHGLK